MKNISDNHTEGNTGEKKWHLQSNFFTRTLFGEVVNIDTLMRHWIIVVSVMAFGIFYISGKYMVMTSEREADNLKEELERVETDRIRVRENYMSRIMETSLTGMVDTARLPLHVQDKPVYHIK